ncbi:MAG TPA: hypothetical protein VNT20_18625 [Flavisolibacter sp.]|jgi:hypothetical protein|nr:hypothetical protein [Flavisolibacter sp.]
MELDELKQGWKRSAESMQIPATDIQSLINDKETGPLIKLRNRFKRGMIIVPLVIAIALSRFPHHHGVTFIILFSFLLVFAFSMTGYFYYNYKLLGRLQTMNISVKEHLQKQVTTLEKGLHFRLIFTRGMVVVFIALVETLMYWGKELAEWYAEPLTTRLMTYVVLFAVFYFVTHLAVKHRYGKNISRLKQLVNELD